MSTYNYQQDIREPETYINESDLGAYKVRISYSIISTRETVNENCNCQNIQYTWFLYSSMSLFQFSESVETTVVNRV